MLTILAAGAVFTASAQSKTTFGVKAGVNFSSLHVSSEGSSNTANSGSLTTFSAGLFADAPIGSKGFSLQPGLFYTGKGGDSNDGISTGKLKLYYLQVPVNVVYNIPFTAGKLFFGGGPYAAYALSGTVKDQVSGRSVSVDVNFGNDINDDFKRTDFGITALAGFQFTNGVLFNINTDLGLSNTLPSNSGGVSVKNRVFGISAGYSF